MRTLVVTNIVSLDGRVAGPGGDVMQMPMDRGFDESNVELMRRADTILLGATSYRGFVSFWPRAHELVPDLGEADAEIARLWREVVDKVVVSDSLTPEETGPWRDSTRIVRRGDALTAVAELKAGAGRDVLVFGSRVLWNALLAAGLVDELHLVIGAASLGGGPPAFAEGVRSPGLRLTDVRRWEGSDTVRLSYAVEH